MTNELNQVQNDVVENNDVAQSDNLFAESTDESVGLFDDYVPEDTPVEDTESPVQEAEQNEESFTEETPEPYELKIKYNGEEINLNEEDARTLAQKGMNYDRFYEPIERLARRNGLSVGDYLNRLNDTQIQYEISKEVQNLKNDPKYDGVSEDILEELATNRVNENVNLRDRNFEEQQRQIADADQAKVQRDIDLFFKEYPEFKNKGPDALNPRVFDYVKQGYTLLEAYNKWSREQVNPQAKVKEKNSKINEENKKKSLGNTTNAGSVEADDFLSGLFSD